MTRLTMPAVLAAALLGSAGAQESRPDPVHTEMRQVAAKLAELLKEHRADALTIDGYKSADGKADHPCSAGYSHALAAALAANGVRTLPAAGFRVDGVIRPVTDRFGLDGVEVKTRLWRGSTNLAVVSVNAYGVGVGAGAAANTKAFAPGLSDADLLKAALRPGTPRVTDDGVTAAGEPRLGLKVLVRTADQGFVPTRLVTPPGACAAHAPDLRAGSVMAFEFVNNTKEPVLAYVTVCGQPVDFLADFPGRRVPPGSPVVIKPGGDRLHGFPVNETSSREFALVDHLPSESLAQPGRTGAVTVLYRATGAAGGRVRGLWAVPGRTRPDSFTVEDVVEGRPLAALSVTFDRPGQ